MDRQKVTVFASVGGVRRCEGQAFFDKYLSIGLRHRNRMAASSYMPPAGYKNGGSDFSKPPLWGATRYSWATAFFLLPSSGISNFCFGFLAFIVPIQFLAAMRLLLWTDFAYYLPARKNPLRWWHDRQQTSEWMRCCFPTRWCHRM